MKRRLRATLVIPGIVFLFAAIALFTRNPPDNGLSVTFRNFTNHKANGPTAVFVITNQRNSTIMFFADRPYELKSNGIWAPPPIYTNTFTPFDSSWSGTLEPGAWTNVLVPMPDETNVWRVAVQSWRPLDTLDRLLFRLRSNWKALREHRALPGFKGEVYSYPTNPSLRTNYSRDYIGGSDLAEPFFFFKIP